MSLTDGRTELWQQYHALHYMQSHSKNQIFITSGGHHSTSTPPKPGNSVLRLYAILNKSATVYGKHLFQTEYLRQLRKIQTATE